MRKVVTNEPLVFVPGLACTAALFAPQIVAFADQPIMVANTCEKESIAEIAEQLLNEAPERFALIGLSMGGYIALEVMRQAPDRVTRLALLSTNARADTPEQAEIRSKQIRIAAEGGYDKVAPSLYPAWVHPSRHEDYELKETVIEMAQDVGPEAFVRQQKAVMSRIDQRENLKAITCPTLVLVGTDDQVMPLDRAEEMHAAITSSALVTVPECGHLSTLEQPSITTKALQEWLVRA
ncbi:alpha/beta hydrolase [Pseudovibrio sp. SPO723]|uniref:alpha/beta fold hydrolase n=1 Tax=Nesiotobacter zosterae TaxID=392721 RepID=UPI0029C19549|nr:alpha/beta hydrolase [Pseudovibrio sp. SPO723]MDX5594858.1 alpha/beta hydrolase [Pseudovibrio sp. SPO723]